MDFWTPHHFKLVTQGQWLREPGAKAAATLTGISTDTRAVKPGQAFLAILGDRFDAHDFLKTASDAGAALLIVQDRAKTQALLDACSDDAARPAVLLVNDTLKALAALASDYRNHLAQSGCKVIAVAGSNGKTTTRHLIHTLLSTRLQGSQSPKSFNNHIGVPLTLLAASAPGSASNQALTQGADLAHDDFVVVETGTNHPGELAALGAIVKPDVCVLTSLGHEHMEFFKTLEGVAHEEKSILPFTHERGLIVLPGDEPLLSDVDIQGPALLRFGASEQCDLQVRDIVESASGLRFTITSGTPNDPENTQKTMHEGSQLHVNTPLLGSHNASNAAAAVAVARWMGLDDEAITQGLSTATPVEMRLVRESIGGPARSVSGTVSAGQSQGILVINDAYNANPSSVEAALKTLVAQPSLSPKGRRVAVLGDMRELGEAGPDLHRHIGKFIAELRQPAPVDLAIFLGKLSLFMAEPLARTWPADRIHTFPIWDDNVPTQVASLLNDGDTILIKASRGMGLERLVPAIRARFA
jgi:UDP-N-acetylmuramoyl-tripeptide--D-alanyl-D-alanine ligase